MVLWWNTVKHRFKSRNVQIIICLKAYSQYFLLKPVYYLSSIQKEGQVKIVFCCNQHYAKSAVEWMFQFKYGLCLKLFLWNSFGNVNESNWKQ